jgi:hypothetical protein
MEKDTNIIPDEEFLREILSEVKNDKPKIESQSDLDLLLLGGDPSTEEDNDKPKEEEKKEDENQPTEKTEEEIAAEEKAARSRFTVKDTISSLIENEVWVDMPIKYGEKTYENISDLLEKEKPSKDLFDLLSSAQKKYREDLISETYIKIGDKESKKAKLIGAILADADYEELLEYDRTVIQRLEKIDFASIKDGDKYAEAFVRQCLVELDKYHPDSIDAVVQKMKSEFRIIEEADKYQKITIENFETEIEKRKADKLASDKLEQDELKKNAKALEEVLTNKNIKKDFAKQILKLRFTKDENGKYHYENMILDKLKDKEFEAKLMHMLLDEDDFFATANSKVKTETSKKFMELIAMTPKEQSAIASKNKGGNLQTEDEDFFKEIGLIK